MGSVDRVAPPDRLAQVVRELVASPAARSETPDRFVRPTERMVPSALANIVCPMCQGALTEAQSDESSQFRGHAGHALTLASLARQQNDETERALWAAVRALEESAARSERLARRGDVELRGRFAEKAGTERRQADQIRRILLRENILPASVRGKSGGES